MVMINNVILVLKIISFVFVAKCARSRIHRYTKRSESTDTNAKPNWNIQIAYAARGSIHSIFQTSVCWNNFQRETYARRRTQYNAFLYSHLQWGERMSERAKERVRERAHDTSTHLRIFCVDSNRTRESPTESNLTKKRRFSAVCIVQKNELSCRRSDDGCGN